MNTRYNIKHIKYKGFLILMLKYCNQFSFMTFNPPYGEFMIEEVPRTFVNLYESLQIWLVDVLTSGHPCFYGGQGALYLYEYNYHTMQILLDVGSYENWLLPEYGGIFVAEDLCFYKNSELWFETQIHEGAAWFVKDDILTNAEKLKVGLVSY